MTLKEFNPHYADNPVAAFCGDSTIHPYVIEKNPNWNAVVTETLELSLPPKSFHWRFPINSIYIADEHPLPTFLYSHNGTSQHHYVHYFRKNPPEPDGTSDWYASPVGSITPFNESSLSSHDALLQDNK